MGTGPLVVRSSIYASGEPFLLAPDGELVETDDFRAVVAMLDPHKGWAGAGGSLWELDFESNSGRLVAEDASSPIGWIELLSE